MSPIVKIAQMELVSGYFCRRGTDIVKVSCAKKIYGILHTRLVRARISRFEDVPAETWVAVRDATNAELELDAANFADFLADKKAWLERTFAKTRTGRARRTGFVNARCGSGSESKRQTEPSTRPEDKVAEEERLAQIVDKIERCIDMYMVKRTLTEGCVNLFARSAVGGGTAAGMLAELVSRIGARDICCWPPEGACEELVRVWSALTRGEVVEMPDAFRAEVEDMICMSVGS